MSGRSAESLQEVIDLFHRWGSDPYDEELGQLDHALQTASLAVAHSAGDALVVAALLHDVGHLLDLRDGHGPSKSDRRHEEVGAAWLRPLFPPAVTAPIALHVRAKRYRCAVDPTYTAGLSAGSVESLARQGGRMDEREVGQFEAMAGHLDAIELRGWDDTAKVVGLEVPALDQYLGVLQRMVTTGR